MVEMLSKKTMQKHLDSCIKCYMDWKISYLRDCVSNFYEAVLDLASKSIR